MKLLSVLTLSAFAVQRSVAFVPLGSPYSRGCSSLKAAMDAEALLRKARQLKAEAEAAAAEEALHKDRLEKKQGKDSDLDSCVDKLFPLNDDSMPGLVNRLKENHWSTDRLLQITKRIHEREICAQGKGQVTASLQNDLTKFDKVSVKDPKELERVGGMIDKLIEAAEIIDEEYMKVKRKNKDQKYLNHVDLDHWTMGDLAGTLRRQVGELRREHEEQFQERLESFYEAQRKNKLHPPKPTDKDKHRP